jgi:hypothetical protein
MSAMSHETTLADAHSIWMNKPRRWDGEQLRSFAMTQINTAIFGLAKFPPCARMELSACPMTDQSA